MQPFVLAEKHGIDRRLLERIVAAAALAPSSHNTQPWIFRIGDDAIEMFADRTRALPQNDPDDRELTISCGCALFNLRVALGAAGLPASIELLPDALQPDLIARVSVSHGGSLPEAEGRLAPQLVRRRTHRGRMKSEAVAPRASRAIESAAEAEGARLRVISDDASRHRISGLVERATAEQWSNSAWRRELARWMRPRQAGDGLTVPRMLAPAIRAVVRSFDLGARVARTGRELAESAPLLGVVVTGRDDPRSWLAAGQALERLLLSASEFGLQASYLNQAVQVAQVRSDLQSMVGDGYPQLVLRVGYPIGHGTRSPRRPFAGVPQGV